MRSARRAQLAVGTLLAILAITVSWWALALWPVSADAPEWLLITREVCFGSTADSLPTPAGWLILVGQPLGMIALLVVVWREDLRAGLALMASRFSGQVAIGALVAGLAVGLAAAVERVRTAGIEPFDTGAEFQQQFTRLNDPAPALRLVDQSGQEVTLESFRSRPVIVTFAFAHCETVCPLVVGDVLAARRRVEGTPPAVLVVTLDPWRDTPSRLRSIANAWQLDGSAHVLSGAPDAVERTLNAWRVPRTRNQQNGDILHPTIVYVIDSDGRIAYVTNGNAQLIAAALRAL
jgi:cytochrome oxidase Cu insertion factor (SCO1/SenC/PrrC family)